MHKALALHKVEYLKFAYMAEEQIYKDGQIEITTKRVMIGGNTYALQNIAGVRVVKRLKLRSLLFSMIGGLFVFIGFLAVSLGPNSGPNGQGGSVPMIFGLCCLGIVFWMGFWKYFLYFDTSSGSASAFKGKKNVVFSLKAHIENAIVARN
jgi:hypothetical protein